MPLLGNAAVAMWWDIAADQRREFEDWHSHEHFPERMSIPGFRRGTRWASADGGEGFFVMYELDRYETLVSEGYLSRLNRPSPWSTKMMPHHRRMVRSQCRVMDSRGGALARHALTVRLSARPGRDEELRGYLSELSARVAGGPGFVAAHLLRPRPPPSRRRPSRRSAAAATRRPTGSTSPSATRRRPCARCATTRWPMPP